MNWLTVAQKKLFKNGINPSSYLLIRHVTNKLPMTHHWSVWYYWGKMDHNATTHDEKFVVSIAVLKSCFEVEKRRIKLLAWCEHKLDSVIWNDSQKNATEHCLITRLSLRKKTITKRSELCSQLSQEKGFFTYKIRSFFHRGTEVRIKEDSPQLRFLERGTGRMIMQWVHSGCFITAFFHLKARKIGGACSDYVPNAALARSIRHT